MGRNVLRSRYVVASVLLVATSACVTILGLEGKNYDSLENDACTQYAKLCGKPYDQMMLGLVADKDQCGQALHQRLSLPDNSPSKPNVTKYVDLDCRKKTDCAGFLDCAAESNVLTGDGQCANDNMLCAGDSNDAGAHAWRCCPGKTCVTASATDRHCSPSEWGCLGNVKYPMPMQTTVRFKFLVADATTRMPAKNIKARVCEKLDIDCTGGKVVDDLTNGVITENKVRVGFDGYFFIQSTLMPSDAGADAGSDPIYMDMLLFLNPPVSRDTDYTSANLAVPIFSFEVFNAIGGTFGAQQSSSLGAVIGNTLDCAGNPVANVHLNMDAMGNVDAGASSTIGLYFLGGAPNPNTDRTDNTGQFGFANVATGLRTLNAERADTMPRQRIGVVTVLVKTKSITYTAVAPSP